MTEGSLQKRQDTPAVRPPESPGERANRIRREAAVIAKGHADIDAGLGIDDDDLEAWLDRLDQNEAAPLPPLGTPASRR